MKSLTFKIILTLAFYLFIIIFISCEASKTSKEKEGLKIDHLTEVSITDLKNRIREFESEISQSIRLRQNAIRDFDKIQGMLIEQLQTADSVISDNKKTKIEILRRISDLESSILLQKQRLQTFRDRNTFQIRIESLKHEIANINRDTELFKNPKLNEIEKFAIEYRYRDIREKFKKLINQVSDESFIQVLLVWQDTLTQRLNTQIGEFENRLDDFSRGIMQDSIKIVYFKNQIANLEKNIVVTIELINALRKDFISDSIAYNKKIENYKEKETILSAKKIAHEIVLLSKTLSIVPYPPPELCKLLRNTQMIHEKLLASLFEYDFNLVSEQINMLTDNIDSLNWKIEDIKNLEGLVKEIFRDQVFTELFLSLGDTTATTKPEFQHYIQAFNANLLTINRFLKLYPFHKIFIDGHADPLIYPESPLYGNKILSRKRTEFTQRKLLQAGVPDSNIIADWYGEFHSQINPDSTGLEGSPKDRRVEMRIIGPSDTSKDARDYMNFRNNYEIIIGNVKKYFYHNEGFWIEKYAGKTKLDTIIIKYKSAVYDSLKKKDQFFKELIDKRPSPIFEKGWVRLGNEVKFVLPIENKNYWIIIREYGAETLDDPRIMLIRSFLEGSSQQLS